MDPKLLEKVARLQAALPYLSETEVAARWATFSETEKVAFMGVLRAAGQAVKNGFGALTARQAVGNVARGVEQTAVRNAPNVAARATQARNTVSRLPSPGASPVAPKAPSLPAAPKPPAPAKPGFLDRASNALGTGMMAMGAGQAAWGAMNPEPKMGSLVKRALAIGLHDALDLGAYGLLASGPVAEVVSPQWAEHNHRALAAADIAGLGILARHHIPGLQPAAH